MAISITNPGEHQIDLEAAFRDLAETSNGIVGMVGDSRLALDSDGPNDNGGCVSAPPFWIRLLSDNKIKIPHALDFSRGGANTNDIVLGDGSQIPPYGEQLDAMQSAGAEAVLIHAGINDVPNGLTLQESNDNWDTLISAALARGLKVIAVIDTPVNTTISGISYNAAQLTQRIQQIHHQRTSYAGTPGLFLIDAWTLFVDSLATDGSPKDDDDFQDGIHYSPQGSKKLAEKIVEVVSPALGGYPAPHISSDAELWSATQPEGNLVPNGFMSGGGSNATGWGGFYSNRSDLDGNASLSLHTDANGDVWQQIDFSGTVGSSPNSFGFYNLRDGLEGPTWASGMVLRASGDIWVVDGHQGLTAVGFGLERIGSDSNDSFAGVIGSNDQKVLPSGEIKGRILLEDVTTDGTSTPRFSYRTFFSTNTGDTVSATVRFRAAVVQHVNP